MRVEYDFGSKVYDACLIGKRCFRVMTVTILYGLSNSSGFLFFRRYILDLFQNMW